MTRRAVFLFILVAALLASGGLATAQPRFSPESAERAFKPGGHVWLELVAGNYRIRPGRDNRAWVEWTINDPDDVGKFKATFETKGNDLLIVTDGARGASVVIEVPRQTNLTARFNAGNLIVEGLVGDKDVSSWAGNVTVEVGPTADYASVDARVTAGDLSAKPFNVSKGGLFRSFAWKGPGKHTVRVRLTAGNLTLR